MPLGVVRYDAERETIKVLAEMDVTLKVNGEKKTAKVSFAQAADFGFAKAWQDSIGNDQNPIRTDTVDYAVLAIKRYEASAGLGIYANDPRDFSDHIASNPNVEVGGFIVLRFSCFPGSDIIGFSHFRRTWANKIILDYLASHPLSACPKDDSKHDVRGVGVGLLYFIAQVLKRENCTALWGEATSLSGKYYKKVFDLERVDDLILASRENIIAFAEKAEREWSAKADDEINTSEQSLDAIYSLEIEHPPFVGSKMAVFHPSKRLAYRFLKLAYHRQLAIAKALSLVDKNVSTIPQNDLAEVVFKGARERGVLATLWNLVETEYGGVTEENPFEAPQN